MLAVVDQYSADRTGFLTFPGLRDEWTIRGVSTFPWSVARPCQPIGGLVRGAVLAFDHLAWTKRPKQQS
jgi:hypothetical protein